MLHLNRVWVVIVASVLCAATLPAQTRSHPAEMRGTAWGAIVLDTAWTILLHPDGHAQLIRSPFRSTVTGRKYEGRYFNRSGIWYVKDDVELCFEWTMRAGPADVNCVVAEMTRTDLSLRGVPFPLKKLDYVDLSRAFPR